MPVESSHLRRLVDTLTGGTEAYVQEKRAAGMSWPKIANDLRDRFNLDISDETLRIWFVDAEKRAS